MPGATEFVFADPKALEAGADDWLRGWFDGHTICKMRLWERIQKGVQMVESNLFGDGEAYELTMGRWSQLVGDKFIDWLDAPRGLRWLDVGCGNGAFTERIISCSAPAEVVAIDPSKEQLAYASTRPGTKLAKFQLGDAQKLPFADGSFDAAVMALVITFIPDPARAVAEMVRVCATGRLDCDVHVGCPCWRTAFGSISRRYEIFGHSSCDATQLCCHFAQRCHARNVGKRRTKID